MEQLEERKLEQVSRLFLLNNDVKRLYSFKLVFYCTNNGVEYEAFILGLNILKDLREKRIVLHGDSKLIINQVKDIYQTKHPKMRSYGNAVLYLFENFTEYTISLIPREKNMIVDDLETSRSVFKIPIYQKRKCEVEVKHKPTIPDNVRHGKCLRMASK